MDLESLMSECCKEKEKLIEDYKDVSEIIKEIKNIILNLEDSEIKTELLEKIKELEKII